MTSRRANNNPDNMAMHLGKLWYMKKIKELIIEAGVEGLRYVKTSTYEKVS